MIPEVHAKRIVARYFANRGTVVYEEVPHPETRQQADLVIIERGLTHAIEVKHCFNLRVIEQAWGWLNYADLVSVAYQIPPYQNHEFQNKVCRYLGIGIIEIDLLPERL